MSGMFNTELVMEELRQEIQRKETYKEPLSYMTNYYIRSIKKLKQESKLVIFGCGVYGRALYNDMMSAGVSNIQCFCDNNKNISGTEYKGCKVYLPQEAFEKYPDACFVITPIGYENEILSQLIDMGISNKKIFIMNMLLTGLTIS
ncbi:MAG: hypothetical protein ACI39N_05925 [Lachnospiraceae bacterium]